MSAKISLCMIVGNVEEYIERCLASFSPIADEIVLVRAIGGQKPDKTIELARAKYPDRIKVGEYRNAKGHEDWPHVDNFAAARQMSFDIATGDYCFWCDSDDVLKDGSAEHVRALANRGNFPCFIFPYEIFARGVTVPRERMMARGSGKWEHAVHEAFEFTIKPVQSVEDNRVVVVHLPIFTGKKAKQGSTARNLRILESIPEEKMTPGLLYHLHGEYVCTNQIPKAIEAAKKALQSKELGPPERYEIMLNLARRSKEPDKIESFLIEAYKADPTRREALALLASNAMDYSQRNRAMAYARHMMATPLPEKPAWNSRSAAYGWLGDEIYAQALRVAGNPNEAERIRRASLTSRGGPRISLIHATRGRPHQASLARKLWLDMAEKPEQVEHVFAIDGDDRESQALTRMHHVIVPPGGGCVRAWNVGAFASGAGVIVQVSDDWTPPPLWDKLILERIGDQNKKSVLAVSDGHRTDKLICLAICTAPYWKEDCFFFHPWFKSVYSDNWFTDLAYSRGAVIEARDLVFEHSHPAFGTATMDRTYEQQNSPERYKEGLELYERLKSGKDWSSCHGWFDYYYFYDNIAGLLKDGQSVAEVGVWMGRSIIYLAQALKRMGKRVRLYAVDSFEGEKGEQEQLKRLADAGGNLRAVFEANIKRCEVDGMIEIIAGDSAESASKIPGGSLAFCFIDAAHDYASVKRDILAWTPKLMPGGIIAGHDARAQGVRSGVIDTLIKPEFAGCIWASEIKAPVLP